MSQNAKAAASFTYACCAVHRGTTSETTGVSNEPLKVDVPVIARSVCNQNYLGQVTTSMICAGYDEGGVDSCSGDSGGPLYGIDANGNYIVGGIGSWGAGCAREGYPYAT